LPSRLIAATVGTILMAAMTDVAALASPAQSEAQEIHCEHQQGQRGQGRHQGASERSPAGAQRRAEARNGGEAGGRKQHEHNRPLVRSRCRVLRVPERIEAGHEQQHPPEQNQAQRDSGPAATVPHPRIIHTLLSGHRRPMIVLRVVPHDPQREAE
jgi:hypothetical protein